MANNITRTRHDSGISLNSSPYCNPISIPSNHIDPFSSSDNDSYSINSSPSNSLLSSPCLIPIKDFNSPNPSTFSLNNTVAGLTIDRKMRRRSINDAKQSIDITPSTIEDGSAPPTPHELSTYAASIIRNEAYALLALASRIDPIISSSPINSSRSNSASSTPALSRRSSSSVSHSYSSSVSSDYDAAIADESEEEIAAVEQSRSNIAFRECIRILSTLPKHGKIIVTGVGKSGIVGRKMVATFCSLGSLLI
jgi:hypothetical protein